MKDNRKINILIGVAALIIVSSVFFIVNRGDPAVKELSTVSRTEVNSIDEIVPENINSFEIPPDLGTVEPIDDVQDVVDASPIAREDLESTNPETVKLASGDIQLVELFAFW